MGDNLFDRIKSFVIKERGKYRKPLTPETTLEKDLKITGDDADEFLYAFAKEFKVDVTCFDISKYFVSEGSLSLVKLTLFGISTGNPQITLRDLEKAVKKGKLE